MDFTQVVSYMAELGIDQVTGDAAISRNPAREVVQQNVEVPTRFVLDSVAEAVKELPYKDTSNVPLFMSQSLNLSLF